LDVDEFGDEIGRESTTGSSEIAPKPVGETVPEARAVGASVK
jgi:hypothetical protein